MIDDLVTRGVTEPYRVVPNRLQLRADTMPISGLPISGSTIGCVSSGGHARTEQNHRMLKEEEFARSVSLTLKEAEPFGLSFLIKMQRYLAFELLLFD